MGNKCTTAKYEVALPSKRAQICASPFPPQNSTQESFSSTRKNKIAETKNSLDTIPNIGSLSAFSSRTRASTCDLGCEETPKLAHTSSTDSNTNSSPTYDSSNAKKTFQYKKGPLIGKGSYGEVNECLNLSSGEIIAAKSVKVYGDLAKLRHYIEALKKEILVLKGLTHPNVVKYLAIETSENKEENCSQIEIVSEYVSGGSIKVLLEKFSKLDERVVSSYTKQILEGLAYLHENEIVHRNIKSSNVLIDAYGTAKLTDFGCFKNLDRFVDLNSPGRTPRSSIRLSSCWEAPEVVMKKSQGKPSDIWSVGCVVLEMLTGLLPWGNLTANLDNVCRLIASGTPPPFPEHISENCRDFLSKCFRFRPEDRPTAEELLEHSFLRETLPSLSCLDFDPQNQHHFQPSLIMKSIDLLQDDIFRDEPQSQQRCEGLHPPKLSAEELNNELTEPSTYLGQNEVIRSNSNRPISPLYPNEPCLKNYPKSQPGNSVEIADNSIVLERVPSLRIKQLSHFEPKQYKNRNSPSPRIRTSHDESFKKVNQLDMTTPIKNSFFSYSNLSIQKSIRDKDLNKTQEISPKTKAQQRQELEEELAQELHGVKLNKLKEDNEEKFYQENKQLSEEEKLELRRKFELDIEQDLLNANKSFLE